MCSDFKNRRKIYFHNPLGIQNQRINNQIKVLANGKYNVKTMNKQIDLYIVYNFQG